MGKRSVSAEEFVKAWQSASSVVELARALGVSREAASVRAYSYRKRGVPLKMFRGSHPPLDVLGLSKIARDAAKGK